MLSANGSVSIMLTYLLGLVPGIWYGDAVKRPPTHEDGTVALPLR